MVEMQKKTAPPEALEIIRASKNAHQLARTLRVSWTTAHRWRIEAGLPSRKPRGALYQPQNSPLAVDLDYIQLLGTMPDRALARKYGISYELVRRQRRAAGLPVYQPPPRPSGGER